MSKAFQVTIDDNRSIVGKAYHGGVTFQFRNGACVTRLSLSYAAINSMGQIAEAVKAAEENKKAANAKRRRPGVIINKAAEAEKARGK